MVVSPPCLHPTTAACSCCCFRGGGVLPVRLSQRLGGCRSTGGAGPGGRGGVLHLALSPGPVLWLVCHRWVGRGGEGASWGGEGWGVRPHIPPATHTRTQTHTPSPRSAPMPVSVSATQWRRLSLSRRGSSPRASSMPSVTWAGGCGWVGACGVVAVEDGRAGAWVAGAPTLCLLLGAYNPPPPPFPLCGTHRAAV